MEPNRKTERIASPMLYEWTTMGGIIPNFVQYPVLSGILHWVGLLSPAGFISRWMQICTIALTVCGLWNAILYEVAKNWNEKGKLYLILCRIILLHLPFASPPPTPLYTLKENSHYEGPTICNAHSPESKNQMEHGENADIIHHYVKRQERHEFKFKVVSR